MRDRRDLDRSTSGDQAPDTPTRSVAWVLLALVLMAGAAVTFFARNGHQTRLDFLFYTKTAPTRWLVLTCLALGALVDRLAVHAWRRRRRRRSRA